MRYLGDSWRWKTKKRRMNMTIMSPPIVYRKYRQPMFDDFGQFFASAHEKFAIKGHATRLPTSWPNAHQMERTVRRY